RVRGSERTGGANGTGAHPGCPGPHSRPQGQRENCHRVRHARGFRSRDRNAARKAIRLTTEDTEEFDCRFAVPIQRQICLKSQWIAGYTASPMATVICMLRGVNLASHNRMKMDALCELFPALACENARTYIQSGNVVFKTRERQLPKLAAGIEAAIQRKFAFRPAAILRTLAELREVVKQNPFAKRRSIEPNKLLVTFLAAEPAAEGRAKLLGI